MSDFARTPQNRLALEQAAVIAQPLATWLVRSGVGYREFAEALKVVYLQAAQAELERTGGKQTDSALNLLSGLHRKDIRALLPGVLIPFGQAAAEVGRSTPANEVVTRWLAEHDGKPLPFTGETDSFEAVARSVSRDIGPRSLLDDLLRLGVVRDTGERVELVQQAFIPDSHRDEAARMVGGSVSDHLSAAVHNLSGADGKTHLDQSVFADGLSADSVRELERLSNRLWRQVLTSLVKAAEPLEAADRKKGGTRRFRLGMYSFSGPMAPAPETADTAVKGQKKGRKK
ncbi:MAG TPA: DUF6502 family protein [Burkholderiaceae bacterium]|nr:DUF6502 family protein [Burkholderiaceae bacterium]